MQEPRTIMVYAESGVGKTSQIYELARYYLKKWKKEGKKKIFRVLNTDGGGSMVYFNDSGLTRAGYVNGIDVSASKIIYLECQAISDGRWPDEKGYRYEETDWHEADLPWIEANVGGYIVEGFDSLANRWKGHIVKSERKIGTAPSFTYTEESEKLGTFTTKGLDKPHYGMVQNELESWWNRQMRNLPVEVIICSSLVAKGKDRKKRTVYGPSSVGEAQAGQIPQWFNDVWHLEQTKLGNEDGTSSDARVAWFSNHLDADTECEYLCKVRTLPEELKVRDEMFPGGFIELIPGKQGIADYYKWKDRER